ncbi:FecR domain-containing protein (plasmid) [Aggregatilineales bacterium SYSU G02658]
MRRWLWIVCLLASVWGVKAQTDLAATLEVLDAGVSVRRVNTAAFIAVTQEAIVGVGDVIRTDNTGRARITFFADGTDTELLPNTEYVIERFSGTEQSFQLSVNVVIGQTIQRLARLIDTESIYDVRTPGMTLVARGTAFAIRVEGTGRSAMLVSEGEVESTQDADSALVPPGFGIRANVGEGLSDVVRATTFAELDAAIDGCVVSVSTPDDVSLNVRQGPSASTALVGIISPSEVTLAYGIVEGGRWYRIAYRGGFGWVLSSTATVAADCAGLRLFAPDWREDIELYTVPAPTFPIVPAVSPTPEATPDS